MTSYLKAWNTIDLEQQRCPHPAFKHLNEKKLSIHSEDLERIISSRVNGIETKTVFIVKASNSNLDRRSPSPVNTSKQDNLPMLTTISREMHKQQHPKYHDEEMHLPLTKTFAKALAQYRSKQFKKNGSFTERRRYFENGGRKHNKQEFRKEQVLVGTKTNFHQKKGGKEEAIREGKGRKEDERRMVGGRKLRCLAVGVKAKIKGEKRREMESDFSPWEIREEEVL